MKRSLTLLAPALTVLLFAGTSARADTLPPTLASYTYNWTPVSVGADLSTLEKVQQNQLLSVFADTTATNPNPGLVSFTNEPAGKAGTNSDAAATNLATASFADPAKPDQFKTTGAYSLALVLTDKASGKSNDGHPGDPAPLVFSGKLNGTFSKNSANVTPTTIDFTPKSVTLGAYTYTVSFIPSQFYAPPGPPSSGNKGAISAHIAVSGGGITVAGVPEPSTMVLSCLGGLSFLGAAWRKRRKAAIA